MAGNAACQSDLRSVYRCNTVDAPLRPISDSRTHEDKHSISLTPNKHMCVCCLWREVSTLHRSLNGSHLREGVDTYSGGTEIRQPRMEGNEVKRQVKYGLYSDIETKYSRFIACFTCRLYFPTASPPPIQLTTEQQAYDIWISTALSSGWIEQATQNDPFWLQFNLTFFAPL